MNTDIIIQLAMVVGAGAGVYAAIKSDLTRAIIKAEQALLDSSKAHERLDVHIENHNK